MPNLVNKISAELGSPTNMQLLGNLQRIVDIQTEELWRLEGMRKYAKPGYEVSSGVERPGVSTTRSAQEIIECYGLDVAEVRDFVGSGTVIDIGCGESTLLDAFPKARTIAVDANAKSVAHQRWKGHEGIAANATDLSAIPSNLGRLVVAHFSVPFWLRTREEALASAKELHRITDNEGLLLVGQVSTALDHEHYEGVLMRLQANQAAMPWHPDNESHESAYAQMVFMGYMLGSQRQGNLSDGAVEIVGRRKRGERGLDFRDPYRDVHVPNYFIIRKAGAVASGVERL